jgi:hypothetical protein
MGVGFNSALLSVLCGSAVSTVLNVKANRRDAENAEQRREDLK